jgi:hypothetical protein
MGFSARRHDPLYRLNAAEEKRNLYIHITFIIIKMRCGVSFHGGGLLLLLLLNDSAPTLNFPSLSLSLKLIRILSAKAENYVVLLKGTPNEVECKQPQTINYAESKL